MLVLTKFIAKGATRICFEHPDNPNKCVKVAVRYKDNHLLLEELKTFCFIKEQLGEYVIGYEPQLVNTNLGDGLVCDLLRDDDGKYLKTLNYYKSQGILDNAVVKQLWHFAYCLIERDIFFYDFNLNNFIVQIKNGRPKLFYIDFKSFEHYKPWTFLRSERFIASLAKYLMVKRLKRLFDILEISEPQV